MDPDVATPASAETILRASGLSRTFRGLQALSDYSVDLRAGEILGVIGPNGAGKTTLFNVITGFIKPTAGTIAFRGQQIGGKPADAILRAGVARTFQNIRLFAGMTALENVVTAQQVRHPASLLSTLVSFPTFRANERQLAATAREYLASLGLEAYADQPATALPYGSQRKLEIARALATGPQVLLLDEPAAGMNHQETAELTAFIRDICRRYNLTIVVVEHDMSLIMRLCDRIQVLNYGRIIAEGTPAEIRANPAVIEAYLGSEEDALALEEPARCW